MTVLESPVFFLFFPHFPQLSQQSSSFFLSLHINFPLHLNVVSYGAERHARPCDKLATLNNELMPNFKS